MSTTLVSPAEVLSQPDVSPERTPQKLQALGLLSPTAVDNLCAERSKTSYLIRDLLRPKTVNITAGDSTIGKSPFVCQLALSVASGQPFLGMDVIQGRVLYLDLENPLEDHKLMRDGIAQHLGLSSVPAEFYIATEGQSGKLEEQIAEVRPKLVVIDSLRAFQPNATEKNAAAAAWLNELRRLARKYDCTFLIVHHLRKPGRDSPIPALEDCTVNVWLDRMEGPKAFTNQTDTRIAIEPTEAGLTVKWNRRLAGDAPLMELERVFDKDGEPLGYRHPTGVERLNAEWPAVFEKLPAEFRFKDVQAASGKTANPCTIFLRQCQALGIAKKLPGNQGYRKASPSERNEVNEVSA